MSSPAVSWERLRTLGSGLTSPLHPDDYFSLLNPLWSSRELRGRLEKIIREADDAATLVIRPGWGWKFEHKPGQFIGIGVEIDGKYLWRSYSLTSPPQKKGRTLSITVRAMPEGRISETLVRSIPPGTIVRLAKPEGEFVMPDPPPSKVLFLVAGSGVTPVMAMLRTLDRRGTMPDVVMNYSSPDPDRRIFHDELVGLGEKHPSLTLQLRDTDVEGMLELSDLDQLVPDWRERQTWACGPGPMLDAVSEYWEAAGLTESLHLERFAVVFGGEDAEGGTVSFQNTGKSVEADGATTVLEAGEKAGVGMPYGCRVGICHTCTLTLLDGAVKDLRTGDVFNQPNEQVQTCVTAPMGDCTLNI